MRIDKTAPLSTATVTGCSLLPLPASCEVTLTPGTHKITYYSVDKAGNQKALKTWSGTVQ